jgi:chaperonin GroES
MISTRTNRVLTATATTTKEGSKMRLRPLGDRVVIKPVEREERTKSGIVLPDTAKEKPQEGLIEAVGNGRFIEATGKREPLDVKVGDRVVYAKYAGSEIKLEEIEYLILSEKDILAVVQPNGAKS